jgi:hypothetical protein
MKESFARVDDALIDRVFQPLVDWIEYRTEFDVFRVARVCIDLAALAWILSQAGNLAQAVGGGNLGLQGFQFAVIVLGLSAMLVLRRLFERTGGRGAGSMGLAANPLRPGMQVHRAACLLWLIGLLVKTVASPFGLAALTLLALGVFATTAVYVGSCSNRPPKRRESRKCDWNLRLAAATR